MLKSIDVLISLSVVMLVCSMAVTALTQAVTNLLNSRGTALKKGIADLIRHLDPGLEQKVAGQIADAVLRNPLVSEADGRLGTVIHRDEFTTVLLHLAADGSAAGLDAQVQGKVKELLANNGIPDASAALASVRAAALQLESFQPQLAANVRQEIAIVQGAGSDLVAKIHSSFDNVMDRVSSRFTQYARYVTFVTGLLLTLFLQLDCFATVNRLTLDDSLRASMVTQAEQITTAVRQASGSSAASKSVDNSYFDYLNRNGILWTPLSRQDWVQHWSWSRASGMLVSFLLINLGAPFWYNALKTLLRLRSVADEKDDEQRSARQTAPPAAPAVGPNPLPAASASAAAPVARPTPALLPATVGNDSR